MSLVQLFYVSRATTPYDNDVVCQILASSRLNNFRDDITGCLLFSGCYFAQVLEGQPAVLHDLGLEDELAVLLNPDGAPADAVVDVMARMRPDTVMGALR